MYINNTFADSIAALVSPHETPKEQKPLLFSTLKLTRHMSTGMIFSLYSFGISLKNIGHYFFQLKNIFTI